MKFTTTVAALLAVGSAAASPVVGGAVQHVERADVKSISDVSSQLETIKGLVDKDFSGSEAPSAADVTDLTDRIDNLIRGIVPLNLDIINKGNLLDIAGVLDTLGGIVSSLTSNLNAGGLQTRQLSYSPIIDVLYPLLHEVSTLVSSVLTAVYGGIGGDVASENPELNQKILTKAQDLSGGVGSLFGILNGLGNL